MGGTSCSREEQGGQWWYEHAGGSRVAVGRGVVPEWSPPPPRLGTGSAGDGVESIVSPSHVVPQAQPWGSCRTRRQWRDWVSRCSTVARPQWPGRRTSLERRSRGWTWPGIRARQARSSPTVAPGEGKRRSTSPFSSVTASLRYLQNVPAKKIALAAVGRYGRAVME